MKRFLLLITILFLALSSFAQEVLPVDSLKADTTKKAVINTDTLKYIPRDPKNPKKAVVTITPGISDSESSKSKTTSAKSTPAKSMSMSMSASTDAGRTPTVIDVSPSGAATYTVPIAVAPGIGGVVPKIALVYNSQAGNGLAGYGWNLSGLSAITRIPRTLFHDDTIGGVNGDIKDRYALDGQRLLLKSGTYGTDGAEYQTENYSNTKIVSHGSLGTGPNGIALGPQYFDVYYADGSHAVYGQDTTSRSKTTYGINYMDNPMGIRISYSYTKSNEVSVISQIAYGGLSSGTAINQINFSYNDRHRYEQMYVGGTEILNTKILSQIDVMGNGNGYRTYALTHDTVADLGYEQIKTVQEISGDGSKSFEPIYFIYGSDYPAITVTESTSNSYPLLWGVRQPNHGVLTADLNGNGKMDVVVYGHNGSDFWIKWDPNQNLHPVDDYIGLSFKDIFASTYLDANNKVAIGQGLVLVQQPAADTIKFETYNPGLFSPLHKAYERVWIAPVSISSCRPNVPDGKITRKYYSGDFNGDGLTDVIAVDNLFYSGSPCQPNTHPKAYFINLDRRLTSNFVIELGTLPTEFNSISSGGSRIHTGDFNGDGKTDLLHIVSGKMFVYSLNANNQLVQLWSTIDSNIRNSKVLIGDYNGDGKSDIMFPISNNDTQAYVFWVLTSKGTEFNIAQKTYPFASTFDYLNGGVNFNMLIATDINNDGKTDIVNLHGYTQDNNYSSTPDNVSMQIYNNLGPGNINDPPNFVLSSSVTRNTNLLAKYPIPLFLSSDKPNHGLEVGLISDESIIQFSNNQDMKTIRALKTVQDGIIHYVDYKVAMKDDGSPLPIYDADEKQVYPYVNMVHAPGIKVVSKFRRVSYGSDVMQLFNYRSAVSNMVGLGYLGFTETVRSSWMANGTAYDPNTIFATNIYDPLLRGAMVRSFTSKAPFDPENINIKNKPGTTPDTTLATAVTAAKTVVAARSVRLLPGFSASGANGTFIAKLDDPITGIADGSNVDVYITRTDYTYNTQLLSSKVFINKPTTVITKDHLNKTNTITSYGYDGYYNLNRQESIFSGHGSKTAHYDFDNDPGSWYFGRITNKKETSTIDGDSFSTEEQYTYNGAFVTQIKRKGNGTGFINEDYEPDAFGNVKKKTVEGTRIIKTEYDASGRFIAKLTDVDGLETNMTYDSSNGTLSSLTNPYSQTTNYSYDAWGREIEAIDYKSNSTRTYYTGSSGISISKENDEGEFTGTAFNVFGQTTFVFGLDVLGQYVVKEYLYDIYGRLISESEPGIISTSQVNTTEYDEYGRVKTLNSYTGKTTNISYNGLQTTVNDGTKTVTTTRDAMGNIKSVQDPGGTINYTYFGNGGLKSTDYGGSGQTIEQDGWGRKTKLTDPSAGVYTYTYNQFGEPLTEVTPKGTTTYTHLADGRLNTKDIVSNNANTNMHYVYDYHPDKQLKSINLDDNVYHNDIDYTYDYDSEHRLTSVSEDNPQAKFTKNLTYDSFNRVLTEANEAKNKSNNITVSKTMINAYAHGQVEEIVVGGNSVWKVTDQDARGHVTTALLGTALKQTNTYDSYGLPQNFNTQKLAPGNPPVSLLELGFVFNAATGNLTSRTNSAFNPTPGNPLSESFTYDTQDRLLTYNEATGPTNRTQSYDARGRITHNGQVGDYTYSGTSYQQTKVTNLTDFAKYHYQPGQNRTPQQIAYNAFKAPVTINENGRERIDFEYNGAEQRSHMYYGDTAITKTARPFVRHYSDDGSMEITEDKVTNKTSFVFYLGGDAYTAPAIWKKEITGTTTTADGLHYLLRDYLSSIVMITNDTGAVEEKRHFDAWGNIVKVEDGAGLALNGLKILDRGYTGHEHLQGVGLINMNARLYDPILHRFLAPDDLVQDPYNTQDYNRYGYVLNNPLKYIDPSGDSIWDWFRKKDNDSPNSTPTEQYGELPEVTIHDTYTPPPSSSGGSCCGFDFNNSTAEYTPIPFMPSGGGYNNAPRVQTYHEFYKRYEFGGTLFSPSNDSHEHKTMRTTTTTNFSSIGIGNYKYIADVRLSRVSANRWRLATDLYFVGTKMAGLRLNYSAFISTNIGRSSTHYFKNEHTVFTEAGVSYLGNFTFEFEENSILGNFNLNIHGGAIIQEWWGATSPFTGATYNVPVPVYKY